LFTSLAIDTSQLSMAGGAMSGVRQLGPGCVFVVALTIGVAGCSNPTRLNGDRRAGQGASVTPTSRPTGIAPSGKYASLGNSAVHLVDNKRFHRNPVADKTKHMKLLKQSVNAVKPTGEIARRKAEGTTQEAHALPVFDWPVQGRIIAGFGASLNGERNEGINLAVPEGTPVTAAEDGIVSYAGDGFQTEGNLVIIRHSDGYFTVYTHSKELLVKRGDEVKRGQTIALSGQTGNVNAPQLHFEIRKGGTPLDPMRFLKS
jgi:murein DD-endopeptidase MepM/ murein hydrolase activator NlpD